MLDAKNDAINKKEDQIARLREQMGTAREIDAKTISDLREQLSITGNNTLSRLHEIVSKQDAVGPGTNTAG